MCVSAKMKTHQNPDMFIQTIVVRCVLTHLNFKAFQPQISILMRNQKRKSIREGGDVYAKELIV